MKGKKMVIAGLVMGMAIGGSVQSFAEPLVRLVEARIHPDYHITFDGEKKEMPEGYEILIYQDRTYVPVRYIAEELGATVNWHEDTKEIEIVKPEIPTTGGAIVPPEENPVTTDTAITTPEIPQVEYKKLPIIQATKDYIAEAFLYASDKDGKRLWLRVENRSDDETLQVEQSSTSVIIREKTYKINLNRAVDFDQRWYSSIQEDEEIEGFLLLPDEIRDEKEVTIKVNFNLTDRLGTERTETVTFDIAL